MSDLKDQPPLGDLSGTRSDGRVILLERLVRCGVKDFRDKQTTNKRDTYVFRVSIILLGALTTVILGTKAFAARAGFADEPTLSALALVMSALVTGLSAVDGLVQPGLKWIDARNMVGGFRQIGEDLEFRLRAPEPLSAKELLAFYDRVKALRSAYDQGWAKNRSLAINGAGTGRRA